MAEAAGEAAYSPDKSQTENVEQTSFIGGPTLAVLSKYLDEAIANDTIPYSPTLGTYITADEATTRYANLKTWYEAHGNFQLGTGPYYVDKAYLVEKSMVLKPYLAYPDLANRWDVFSAPKLSVVDITAPAGQVKIGKEATFDIAVSYNGQPYPQADIKQVKYLLYDATGAVVKTADATFVSDGQYQVVLTADDTKTLTAGSNKFEVAVVSNAVAIPTFASVEFVTVP
jgi:peptide/nickel transport system substrate-binding protein